MISIEMRNIIHILLLILVALLPNVAIAQPGFHRIHYSVEDGLPQQVVDIIQDKKGQIWIATWNGLCRFDGYQFVNYLSDPFSDYYIRNNRIDRIREDNYGYIWALSYDGVAHRFDPKIEIFTGIPTTPEFEQFSFIVTQIIPMPSGKVWLISEKSGCICVVDSTLKKELYHIENKRLKSEKVRVVHEDQQQRTWLLTDNGVAMIAPGNTEPVIFFSEDYRSPDFWQSFHSVLELDNEIWFGSNNGRIWKYNKEDGQFSLFDLPTSSNIFQMKKVGEFIVIASSGNGIFIFDSSTGKIEGWKDSGSAPMSNRIASIAADHLENVWIATDQTGVFKLNVRTRKIKYFESILQDINEYNHPTMFIIEDSAKRIWVHPKGGGFACYDPGKDDLIPLHHHFSSAGDYSGILRMVCCDRQGNLWLASRLHGMDKIIFDNNSFKITKLDNEDVKMNNEVRAIFEDKTGNLWVSTRDGSVRVFDAKRNFLGFLCHDGTIGNGKMIKGIVYCIHQDNDGNMWLGTRGEGIYRLQPRKTYQYHINNFKNHPDSIYSLSNNNIYAILQDSRGNIWAGTYGGGINLLKHNGNNNIQFINHRNHLTNYPIDAASRVRCINEDSFGKICVGTTVGLIMFDSDFAAPENIEYHYYSHKSNDDESLTNNDIQDICITADGNMYLATFGGGINRVETRNEQDYPLKFKAYTRKNGLPSNVTLSMIEAAGGTLWVSMENNLSQFDPDKGIFETFAEIGRLVGNNLFSEGAKTRLRSDEILFGFSKGILSFSPQQIANSSYIPPLIFTNFRLFNKDVEIGEDTPLTKQIDNIDKLILTHHQNFFSIEYAALDFRDPGNILYAYKLEGFDEDWVYMQKQRIANYTNLPKGNYVFCVKSTNSDGVWVDNQRRLHIIVLPSFWETHWAYMLYVIIFALLLMGGVYILSTIYRLKHKVELETQLSEMKIRFFTDISHEIRTPLTMITAPVDYLVHDKNTPPEIRKQLGFVARNTQRMLHMVNQVLDLRKFQHLKLRVEEIKIADFTGNICKSFDEIAEKQRISFQFIDQSENSTVWADRDCLEKMIFNLLSNAFKYTPAGKNITLRIVGSNESVNLLVEDEGKGIAKDKVEQIFTRFAAFNDDKGKPSTGIGLNMVKDLADKHHATVSVESVPNEGSRFTVTFRKGYAHFGKNVNLIVPERLEHVEAASEDTVSETHETAGSHKRSSILIVEDDEQLRLFLKTILEHEYRIFEATDGEAGYKKAMETIPDFIVSDVMMPHMDGLQMLQQLKTSINTSHIPVVLLTAKAAIENMLEGLEYGADDYITKPFSVPYFRARIQNLLKQREQLQQLYCSNLFAKQNTFAPQQPCISSHDDDFMHKVMQEIEHNMDNDGYSVDTMAATIGVSRTILLRKIKGLTGLTPVEFIRDIKLQRAAQLLSTRQLSVKEVIYMVGMTDAKYFRECFRKKYGKTPREFLDATIS